MVEVVVMVVEVVVDVEVVPLFQKNKIILVPNTFLVYVLIDQVQFRRKSKLIALFFNFNISCFFSFLKIKYQKYKLFRQFFTEI